MTTEAVGRPRKCPQVLVLDVCWGCRVSGGVSALWELSPWRPCDQAAVATATCPETPSVVGRQDFQAPAGRTVAPSLGDG